MPAEDRDAVTFTIPWDDGTTAEGTAFEDESDEANSFATTQPRQTGSPTGTARIS